MEQTSVICKQKVTFLQKFFLKIASIYNFCVAVSKEPAGASHCVSSQYLVKQITLDPKFIKYPWDTRWYRTPRICWRMPTAVCAKSHLCLHIIGNNRNIRQYFQLMDIHIHLPVFISVFLDPVWLFHRCRIPQRTRVVITSLFHKKTQRHRHAVFLRNEGATITLCAHWVCLSADQLPVAPVTKYTSQ